MASLTAEERADLLIAAADGNIGRAYRELEAADVKTFVASLCFLIVFSLLTVALVGIPLQVPMMYYVWSSIIVFMFSGYVALNDKNLQLGPSVGIKKALSRRLAEQNKH